MVPRLLPPSVFRFGIVIALVLLVSQILIGQELPDAGGDAGPDTGLLEESSEAGETTAPGADNPDTEPLEGLDEGGEAAAPGADNPDAEPLEGLDEGEEASAAGDDEPGRELLERSLESDIRTSRREELIAWCQVLKLPIDGTVEQLKSRLRTYYNLKDTEKIAEPAKISGDQITIKSAKRSEYFEVEITGGEKESVVRLDGDVFLTVNESERGRKHQVWADTVLFNGGNNTISAVGHIKYIVDTQGREETFTGDSLTFEVSDWTGVIFHGTSKRNEEIDKKDVPFFFRGDAIKRASSDILVLTDGSISSYDVDNPDYALKAKKIWITGPGEWSIFSATIYVGHIPVLYLPFYWKSGRDLFFNPVIGERTGVGYYIQTTTYLIGRRGEDDDFSMLGFGDSAGGEYDLVREGLYLVKKPRKTGSTKNTADTEKSKQTEQTGTLKYTLDAYTSLGAATGISGTFPKLLEGGSLDFYASLGVSRSIGSSGETYFNDGSSSRTYWNNSYIGSAKLPFRWGSSVDLKYKKWKLYLTWYSDPYYLQDFGDRKENFDWLKLLLGEEDTAKEPNLISSMKWELSGSHSFRFPKASPWLSSLSLSKIRASLTWKNKDNDSITSSANPDKSFDPARKFFYPDQLVLPDVKISLKGSLPSYTVNRIEKGGEETDSESDTPDSDAAASQSSPIGVDNLAPIGSFDTIYRSKLFEASLKYGLDSQFYMDDQLLNTSWSEPSDIDFGEFKAAKINTIHKGNIQYGLKFWDGLLGFSGATSLSGYYRVHEPVFGSDSPVEDATKLEDYKYSKFLWDNSLTLNFKPLQGIHELSASSIKYTIDANILNYQWSDTATVNEPEYQFQWIDEADDFTKHETAVSLDFKRSPFSFTSSFTTNLPPLGQQYKIQAAAGFAYKGIKVNLSQKNVFEDAAWEHEPLDMSASWTGWKDEVTVSQSAQYDFENARFTKSESLIKFWGFQARLIASYAATYDWNDTSSSWTEGPKAFTPSTLEFAYKRTIDLQPSWKNRIRSKTILDTSWKINLAKPTDNVFRFKWTQEFKIYKFLDLKISFSAINRSMYLYFSGWRDQLNITTEYNFFEDLAKSFNIFNTQDRLNSQFNMEKVQVSLIHHLRNWDVTMEYSGWPTLNAAAKTYDWKSEFSIYIKWNPLPIFNQKTTYKDETWSVESFGDNVDSK